SQMSCTALPNASSSVLGRAVVCGRLAADGGATGRADGLGTVAWVALATLVAAAAVTAGLATAPGADPAEQPVSTARPAATATATAGTAGRATARRCAPRTTPPWFITSDDGTQCGPRQSGDREVQWRVIPVAQLSGGGRRAPRSPRAAAAGTRAAGA